MTLLQINCEHCISMYKYCVFEALCLPPKAAGYWLSHCVSILDDSIFSSVPAFTLKFPLLTKLFLNKHESVSFFQKPSTDFCSLPPPSFFFPLSFPLFFPFSGWRGSSSQLAFLHTSFNKRTVLQPYQSYLYSSNENSEEKGQKTN